MILRQFSFLHERYPPFVHTIRELLAQRRLILFPLHQDTLAWKYTIYLHILFWLSFSHWTCRTFESLNTLQAFPGQFILTVKHGCGLGSFTSGIQLFPLTFDTHFLSLTFHTHLFPSAIDTPFSSSMYANWLFFVSGWTKRWWLPVDILWALHVFARLFRQMAAFWHSSSAPNMAS